MRHWLVFLLLTSASITNAYSFWLNEAPAADIRPSDSLVIIGETVRVTCTSASKFNGDVSQAKFKVTVANGTSWFLPTDNQTDIGFSTVQTYLHISEDFAARNTLACFNGDQYLGSTKMYAEKRLVNVSNAKAIFYDNNRGHVQLSWSANSEYYKCPDAVDTKVLYAYGGIPMDWDYGSSCDADLESCEAVGYGGQFDIYVRFTVSYPTLNRRPDPEYLLQPLQVTELTTLHHFFLDDIRKIGPVTDINVVDVGKTCVKLSWTLPFFLRVACYACSNYVYEIDFVEEKSGSLKVLEGVQDLSIKIVQVCNLTPYTTYSLTVRVKADLVNPWSDASTLARLTTARGNFPELAQLPDITFKVQEIPNGDGSRKTLSVTWDPKVFQLTKNNVTLLFYMCEEGLPNTCIDGFKTFQVGFHEGHMLVDDVSHSENLFGYALTNDRGQKTGVEWTNCVYQDGVAPDAPTGLQAFPGQEAGSVHVVWSSIRCDRCRKVLVTHYSLSICPEGQRPDHHSCLAVTVESDQTGHHKFDHVPGDRWHHVFLRAESSGGSSPVTSFSLRASNTEL